MSFILLSFLLLSLPIQSAVLLPQRSTPETPDTSIFLSSVYFTLSGITYFSNKHTHFRRKIGGFPRFKYGWQSSEAQNNIYY